MANEKQVPENIMIDMRVAPQHDELSVSNSGQSIGMMVQYQRLDVVERREKQLILNIETLQHTIEHMANSAQIVSMTHKFDEQSDIDCLTIVLSDGTIRQGDFDAALQEYVWREFESALKNPV